MRAILTYHSIDDSGSVISVDPARFTRQIRWISQSGLEVVPLDRITQPGGDAVSITFDDAFRNFSDVALPVLLDAGVGATVFVPTARVGMTNKWDSAPARHEVPELPLMSWPELARAAERGVALGGHGRKHVEVVGLSRDELLGEVCGAAEDIRRETGVDAAAFAYPYGRWDQQALEEARQCYSLGCSTDFRVLDPGDDRHLLPRLDMYYLRAQGRLETFGTRAFARYIGARRLARSVRSMLMP